MDIGTGDGGFVLDRARALPDHFVIGLDPVAAAMAEASRRTAARPERGGVPNARFVQASLEALPPVLTGLATHVSVNYPWGSLLRAVALPDDALLSRLVSEGCAGAAFEIRINLHPLQDAAQARRLGLTEAAVLGPPDRLATHYAKAGLVIESTGRATPETMAATRWGKQLRSGGRDILFVRARRDGASSG